MNDSDFRVCGLLLTLEIVCITFCMRNPVKWAFERRNILNGREIRHYFRQNRRMITILEFLGLFDAGKRMHYVLHAKWSEMGVLRSKYLKRERNNA